MKSEDIEKLFPIPEPMRSKTYVMICTGECYDSRIVHGKDLVKAWAEAVFGTVEEAPKENVQSAFEDLSHEDNWKFDSDRGPTHFQEDVGEMDHIEFYLLTETKVL